jgi:hypothetical protein
MREAHGMTNKDDERQPRRPAGAVSLPKYRAHGGGMELFRAYVERRNADQQASLNRKAEIIATMTPEAGCNVPIDAFERAGSELVMIQILEEMDPIIQELLGFCENQPEGKNELSELRFLLKINDGHDPLASSQTERQWEIEQRWIAAYLQMQDSNEYRPENQLSKQIAESLPAAFQIGPQRIGPRQVLNHGVPVISMQITTVARSSGH